MLFGKLDDTWMINEALKDNVNTYNQLNASKKSNGFSKLLQLLSHYGMNWDDQVLKNMKAIPADKAKILKTDELLVSDMVNSQLNKWREKQNEDKNFFEKDLKDKIEILRKMAMLPELERILDIMSNEAIVYDDDYTYVCNPYIDNGVLQLLNEESINEIKNAVDSIFYRIYYLCSWKSKAWYLFKRFLIEGVLAFEIIYDDLKNPKNIIGIESLDPLTLTKEIIDGVAYWVQFKGTMNRERTLIDAQIIYIKYTDTGVENRQSYLERLIRPFNIYRIVEQAQIIWTVTLASFKTIFTIPVGSMNKAKGMQTLNSAMSRYKEDISFNIDSGELTVNGKVNQPFNQEYWFPENQNGKPEIETLVDNGPLLADNEQLKFFRSELYAASNIPENRFDKESQSTWFGTDASAVLRDEINFSRFVTRLRYEFSKILLKPILIQLSLLVPNIKNDKRILDAIQIRFNTYNQFEELMDIEVNTKRLEFILTMKDSLSETDADGNETPYFCSKFLVTKYLHMSNADLELNEKFKLEGKTVETENDETETEEGTSEENEFGNDNEEETSETEETGGGETEEATEPESTGGGAEKIDADMLGDVKPENT